MSQLSYSQIMHMCSGDVLADVVLYLPGTDLHKSLLATLDNSERALSMHVAGDMPLLHRLGRMLEVASYAPGVIPPATYSCLHGLHRALSKNSANPTQESLQ